MDSYSRSIPCLDNEALIPSSNEKMDVYDLDTTCKAQAWSRHNYKSIISHRSIIHSFVCLGRFLWGLVSLLSLSGVQREPGKPVKLHPSAYLDGMRGLAAFAVFLCHLSYSTFDVTHVYGTGKLGENMWFWQLPIVRLFYSGAPQVAIFFVISGYALSYKPIKLMRTKQHEALMATLSSSVFRRALRLFLPCFVSTFLISCVAQMGVYKMTEDFAYSMRINHESHAWTAPTPMSQLAYWAHQMFAFLNVFDWSLYAGSTDLDQHLWTIPTEYRCSMALFITHVLVARMSTKIRLSTLSVLILWGARWDRWELCPFWAGAILAEMDLMKLAMSNQNEPTGISLPDQHAVSGNKTRSSWLKVAYLAVFISGLYLASFPDADGHIAPGYIFLNQMIPEDFTEKHRFWPTIGAVLIVWSVSNLTYLRRIFTSAPLQYLGKISFPLYVMHGPVIHTFGYMVMDKMLNITGYDEANLTPFKLGFCISALSIILVTIWCADIFLRTVDVHCVTLAKWLDDKLLDR